MPNCTFSNHCASIMLSPLLILAAFVATLLATSNRPAFAESVRVGVYENSPKVFTNDKGQPDGLFIYLIQSIAEQEGWEIVFEKGSWSECLDMLSKGTIDLMPDMAFTDERGKLYDFNKEPVLSSWSQVFVHHDSSIKSIFDLDGKKIAALKGSVQVEELQRSLREFGMLCEFTLTSNFDEAFELVRTGKTDAAVSNRFFGLANKGKYGLQETTIVFSPASLYFATKKATNSHLLVAIDRLLREMKADSSSAYYKVLAKWTGGAVTEIIPSFIYWIGGAAFLLILLGASVSYLLKQQVNAKTKALVKKNESLRIVIEELEKARELALRQERLHALGQMASGITHDFNNVLSPIIGYTDLLLNSTNYRNDPEKRDKLLRIILGAANDGAEIVGRMRQFYRQQTDASTTEIAINQLLHDTIDLAKPRLESQTQARNTSVEIVTLLQADKKISANPTILREAILNLMFNALDAMPKGGQLCISSRTDEEFVEVSVSDTGTGMTPEIKEKCLQPFFTTKGDKGTGMGLAMVRSIVEEMSGSLAIESEVGKGTKVILRLPISESIETKKDTTLRPAGIRKLRVLAVDDDVRNLDLLVTFLKDDGHHVDSFLDPIEAFEMVLENKYDLIITDCAMKPISGRELALRLNRLFPNILIIMVSGFEDFEQDDQCPEGIKLVLRKPISLSALRNGFAMLGLT